MQKIYINCTEPFDLEFPITACIGYFDGLHKGHQALIQEVMDISEKDHTTPTLISFQPDPWTVLRKIENPPHILSNKDREQYIEQMGIECYIILEFNQALAKLDIQGFHKILDNLQVKTLVCGFDFHYGINGSGSIESLKKQTLFHVSIIDKIEDHDEKVSSSRIERCITHGNMEEAMDLLTRPFKMSGTIIKGSQIGHTYGFPTANLQLDDTYVCPKGGVYIGIVCLHQRKYGAIINIGNNPTFNYQQHISIEAHILDFDQDIYGETCSFEFFQFIRSEERFPSKDALIQQLQKDRQQAIDYFHEKKEYLICD